MSETVADLSDQFQIYYQNNSLLFQLMLTEMIGVNLLIGELIKRDELKETIESPDDVQQILFKLLGDLSRHNPKTPPHLNVGPLSRLRYYMNFFYKNSIGCKKGLTKLYGNINQAWVDAVAQLNLTYSFLNKIFDPDEHPIFFKRLRRGLKGLLRLIFRLSKGIMELVHSFKTDENVLFFLLRKKEALKNVCGTNFWIKIVQPLFKKEDLASFLVQSYNSRGFNEITLSIKKELFKHELIEC